MSPEPESSPDVAFLSYYNTARSELLGLLEGGPAPARALEIGCGTGANLAEVKRRFPHCRTIGIEINETAAVLAEQAGNVDELHVGDVRDPAIASVAPDSVDLIILSHVLEHFAEPEGVLRACKSYLRKEGRMLIALPNIRHYSVLKQLLVNGDFRYQDHGILDRTHLRFFTRKSAKDFLAACGLEVVRAKPEIEGRGSRLLNAVTLGRGAEFAAYAYNFLVMSSDRP